MASGEEAPIERNLTGAPRFHAFPDGGHGDDSRRLPKVVPKATIARTSNTGRLYVWPIAELRRSCDARAQDDLECLQGRERRGSTDLTSRYEPGD